MRQRGKKLHDCACTSYKYVLFNNIKVKVKGAWNKAFSDSCPNQQAYLGESSNLSEATSKRLYSRHPSLFKDVRAKIF